MATNYGSKSYWDDRYENEFPEPFDWLCDYEHVQDPVRQLLPKEAEILIPGCGNAIFSEDMHNDGYHGIVNVDVSPVVIEQQKERYPNMTWEVMDCLKMPVENGRYFGIVDKSLIDTILCANNSTFNIKEMVSEMYRVLAPNGIYISISLHSEDDIIDYFMTEDYDWHVSTYRIRNPRWDTSRGVKRSTAHTLVICHKVPPGEKSVLSSINLEGVLSDSEAEELQEIARVAADERLFRLLTVEDLASALNSALATYMERAPDTLRKM